MIMNIETIAAICHAANKRLCEGHGDFSQRHWEDAAGWQKASAIAGVHWRISNPGSSPGAQHEQWCADKRADGWQHGPVKDADKKTHPCLVPYDCLPFHQRVKDRLFCAIVDALA